MASQKPTIGFCGLGAMGFGMATNLVKQGYTVKGFDVFQKSVDRFVEAGGKGATSLTESAESNPFYICMVATAQQAQDAIFDNEKSILKGMPKGATLLLCSTVPSSYAQSVEKQLKEVGREDIFFIDAPVSGGAVRAANGTLSIMAGASDAAMEKGKLLLQEMSDSKKLFLVEGGIGAGSNMKAAHQVLAAIQILSTSEAMGLAAKLGLDARKTREAVIKSDGWSWMFENRTPRTIEEDYYPGVSALTIILKDAGIITALSRLVRFPAPLTSIAEQVYFGGLNQGFGGHDDAGMVRVYYPEPVTKVECKLSAEEEKTKTDLVVKMLRAIHTLAAAESIAFARHVGLPLDQLYELASDAAGGSTQFREAGAAIIKGLKGDESVWKAGSRRSLGGLTDELKEVVDEAQKVKCPVHLASGALNLALLTQQHAGKDVADINVIKTWAAA